jgi:transposase-like protein
VPISCQLAREFEPTAQTIRNWVAQVDRDQGRRSDGSPSAERQELNRLRRENANSKWSATFSLAPRPGSLGRRRRNLEDVDL